MEYELALKQGKSLLGVDEVGRGCLAGPVYTACVSLNYAAVKKLPRKMRNLIRDSKKLSSEQRVSIIPTIHELATEAHIGEAKVHEIEIHGIAGAIYLAMHRAISRCRTSFDLLLVDGKCKLPNYAGEQMTIVGGDDLCFAIAAASIIAKEARDSHMRQLAKEFPNYGFHKHVGYATKQHLSMIEKHGICDLHRGNFRPITTYGKQFQTNY